MLICLTIFLPKVVVRDLRYVSARACWSVASETWLASAARIGVKVLHSGTRLEGDEPTRDKMSVTTRFVHGVTRFIALLSTSYDAFHNAHNVDMLLCDMSNTDIQKGTRLSIPCVLSKLKYCS